MACALRRRPARNDRLRAREPARRLPRARSRRADDPLIHYFDATLTARDLDRSSADLAAGLGIARGDRVALYLHPAVREAAVVGVPDVYRGETVKAFVSLRPGSAATPGELIHFCRARLAAYKYPRAVEVVDELPKTASGKILRRELRGGA